MTLKRMLPFFVIIFALTGCFRQASDTFDTVDSSSSGGGDAATQVIAPPATATEESAITIIAPGLDDETLTVEATDTEAQIASGDEATDVPDEPTTQPTSTNLPPPTAESNTGTLPTATQPAFITPEINTVIEITSPTPVASATRAGGLLSTPSDEETTVDVTPVGDCEYVVVSGDNAFRIALDHNVTLDELLAENELPANPVLQIGQVLLIPGCEDGAPAADMADTTVDAESTAESTEAAEPAVVLEDGFRLHTVVAGESLLVIARRYGVTVNAVIAENPDLTNPNRIIPGMELLIPPAEGE
jgi:LysM repeat protein